MQTYPSEEPETPEAPEAPPPDPNAIQLPKRATPNWQRFMDRIVPLIGPIVEQISGYDWDHLLMENRSVHTVRARWLAMALLSHCGLNPMEISRIFHRDHSTIVHGLIQGAKSVPVQHDMEVAKESLGREIHILCNSLQGTRSPADLDWAMQRSLLNQRYPSTAIEDIRMFVLGALTSLYPRYDPLAARRGQLLLTDDAHCHEAVKAAMIHTGFSPWVNLLRDRSRRRA